MSDTIEFKATRTGPGEFEVVRIHFDPDAVLHVLVDSEGIVRQWSNGSPDTVAQINREHVESRSGLRWIPRNSSAGLEIGKPLP